jgi:hypothetical protein
VIDLSKATGRRYLHLETTANAVESTGLKLVAVRDYFLTGLLEIHRPNLIETEHLFQDAQYHGLLVKGEFGLETSREQLHNKLSVQLSAKFEISTSEFLRLAALRHGSG